MLIDFEVQRSTRRCAATDRPLEPGDDCYAVLESAGSAVIRKDYCRDAWNGPPQNVIAWWKWRVPMPTAKKLKLAPSDVLLDLFDQSNENAAQVDMRYVLALLLVRRRVFRLEEPADLASGESPAAKDDGRSATADSNLAEVLTVYCSRRETTYHVSAAMPSEVRIDEIQQQLSELLMSGGE